MDDLHYSKFVSIQNCSHPSLLSGVHYPWEVIGKIEGYLKEYFKEKHTQAALNVIGHPYIDANQVHIGANTTVEHGACILGPTIIGDNCHIRTGAYIRGCAIIGNNCIIGHASEVKNSIVCNDAQISHFNYVGDSLLGYKSHLAAGAITSNLKLDCTEVVVHSFQGDIKTGLIKFGSVVGDHAEVGSNVVLNPGTLLGKFSVVYPGVSFRGHLKDNSICKLKQQQIIIPKS